MSLPNASSQPTVCSTSPQSAEWRAFQTEGATSAPWVIRELTAEQPSLLPRDAVDIDDLLAELVTTPHGANAIADGRKWVAENFYSGSASLAALRLQRGWSQAELARQVGTSQSYIGRLEKNVIDPQLSTVRKIARALGVPVAAVDEALTPEKTS